jgi:AraC-like DNA-binding protein
MTNETNESGYTAISPRNKYKDWRINQVIDHLHDHSDEKIVLDDLSKIALLSPCHLLRVFKKTVGLTPKAYLLHLRVEKAIALLQRGLPLSVVVQQTGFTDKSHLARTVKNLTGKTPKSFQ